ncbi:MAG: hypothetical protein JXD22_06655, partial [Sedimentisphaerales bacterium]|nr:hypothetical protein [Sedimentisphaerales bacterium]
TIFITLPEVREIFNAQHRCLSKLLTQASKLGKVGFFLQKFAIFEKGLSRFWPGGLATEK